MQSHDAIVAILQTLLGSVLHLYAGTPCRQVSSFRVQGAHIVRQLKAGCLRLGRLDIAPGQAERKDGGRHDATAWRCSLCNLPAVRAFLRSG